ncbi:hypothetical protein [Aurantibacter sp.]|uniref:hypothetical protein n=1 Tax=Aurantibacter sp. TaxID=2807103 RepID=UPI0035C7BB84
MKRFIKKLSLFILPFIIIIIVIQFFDFFKIYADYPDYFKNNRISKNRTVIATKTFFKYKDSIPYNTFTFGNSRAQAYKNSSLIKHFGKKTKPFHFDSDGESLYGIYKKIEFLSLNKANLTNVIIILDASTLSVTKQRNAYNYINPPEFKDVSQFKFYSTFIQASSNIKLITALADYNIFKTKRDYINKCILTVKYFDHYDPFTLDCSYNNEIALKKDSILYYKKDFSKRKSYIKPYIEPTKKHTDLFQKINRILKTNKSNYTIIVSPLYNQNPINKEYLTLLNDIFGFENVFDFSGKNQFTEHVGHYYEWSHYKPFLAEQLLDSIYKKRASY